MNESTQWPRLNEWREVSQGGLAYAMSAMTNGGIKAIRRGPLAEEVIGIGNDMDEVLEICKADLPQRDKVHAEQLEQIRELLKTEPPQL